MELFAKRCPQIATIRLFFNALCRNRADHEALIAHRLQFFMCPGYRILAFGMIAPQGIFHLLHR